MASSKKTTTVEQPDATLFADNMTKRSKRKLRRFHHQLRLEKKTLSADELKQLPNYCQENINETDYYYQNGLQKVYPYYYDFSTYVKGRWMGKTVLDVCSKEFLSETPEYYKKAIEEGRVTINGKHITTEFVLCQNHLLQHRLHRHENPIIQADLQILADTEELLVVNKPSSWPVHPCGRYRYNSLTFILEKQYGYKNLRGLYRLDRLTSGVFMMAKTSDAAAKIFKEINERQVQKEYIARVVGRFPDGVVECNKPLSCVSHKLALYRVDPKGKDSSTTFERLSYNGRTSIVKCMPHTGRTHQIRVHLQYLGHPIVNDNFYNSEAFGPERGKGGVCDVPQAKLEEDIIKKHDVGQFVDPQGHQLYKRKLAARNQSKTQSQNKSDDISASVDHNIGEPSEKSLKLTESERISEEETGFTETFKACADLNEPPEKRIKADRCSSDSADDHAQIMIASDIGVVKDNVEKNNKNSGNATEGEELGKNIENSIKDNAQLTARTSNAQVDNNQVDIDRSLESTTSTLSATCDKSTNDKTAQSDGDTIKVSVIEDYNVEKMYDVIDLDCKDCKVKYLDPAKEDLIMYLHAYRYKGTDWEYSTPLPDWAQEDWSE